MGQQFQKKALGALLGALTFGVSPGCLSCLNPVAGPRADCLETCHALPQPCRNHVYVFFMNGLDPVNCCNLTGLRDCVQKLGFIKTYYGQPMHFYWFASEIRRLHCEEADARFVLVGSQWGANLVCSLADYLRYDNVSIDLAVLLDGTTLDCNPRHRAGNIARVVHLWSGQGILKGKEYPGAENVCIEDGRTLGCVGHPETVERLALELSVLAASVPVPAGEPLVPETAPEPRPVEEQMPQVSKEWDFLLPRPNRPDFLAPTGSPSSTQLSGMSPK